VPGSLDILIFLREGCGQGCVQFFLIPLDLLHVKGNFGGLQGRGFYESQIGLAEGEVSTGKP